MLIRYYKDNNITYTSRKRYENIPISHFSEEEQKSVLLGDGATTSIKTSKNNICDYVTIDGTRWFVTSYIYMNGGQITLNLQRDVVGEFGISNCFGKIERGYTDSILKNKKELSLNQILKKRIPLIPENKTYGNLKSIPETNELYGILYLSKPTTAENSININIPSFTVDTNSELEYIEKGQYAQSSTANISFSVYVCVIYKYNSSRYSVNKVEVNFSIHNTVTGYVSTYSINRIGQFILEYEDIAQYSNTTAPLQCFNFFINEEVSDGNAFASFREYLQDVCGLLDNSQLITKPNIVYKNISNNYNNAIIKNNDEYIKYNLTLNNYRLVYGSINDNNINLIQDAFLFGDYTYGNLDCNISFTSGIPNIGYKPALNKKVCNENVNYTYVNYSTLTPEEAGVLVLDLQKDLIDEPYVIYVIPLFSGKTVFNNITERDIDKEYSFKVFNSVIQSLSGENGYLVDAQIFPYCPDIDKEVSILNGYVFYSIKSTSYERNFYINTLNVDNDVKKEYITKEYSITSPEQSDKFSFNFYDYKISNTPLQITLKTSLKPFSIISSAIINRDDGSLMGLNYNTNLNGCQPSSNGFEVSLSTNAFQQYMRNNSNYEKIFNKNQEYLFKQQNTERQNELIQKQVNTISAGMMGAIGGASLGNSIGGAFNPIAGAVGAGVGAISGGLLASGIVSKAMEKQVNINDKLRSYEYSLQKELFDLNIGQIKNLPNTINRISSFNEIIAKEFWYILEEYECSEYEKELVDLFIEKYSYSLGVYGNFINYYKNGWFIKGNLITSNYNAILHDIANKELNGGIYYYAD